MTILTLHKDFGTNYKKFHNLVLIQLEPELRPKNGLAWAAAEMQYNHFTSFLTFYDILRYQSLMQNYTVRTSQGKMNYSRICHGRFWFNVN